MATVVPHGVSGINSFRFKAMDPTLSFEQDMKHSISPILRGYLEVFSLFLFFSPQ